MKKNLIFLLVTILFFSCKNGKQIPDVSNIKVDLQVERFEQDFFKADTNNLTAHFDKLGAKYKGFFPDYLSNIVGLTPPVDTIVLQAKYFIGSYKPVYDSSLAVFKNFDGLANQVKQGLQFVKYYFPKYSLPNKLITFIGPMNSFANIITPEGLCVGLQSYMGNQFSWYNTERFQVEYPKFISRKFSPEYIPVNCIRNIIETDLFPPSNNSRTLIEQMVEAGKRLYLLDAFMPNAPDTLKIGYTAEQLKGCYENESNIWGLFVNNDLLFATEPSIIKDYMNDGPSTTALGEKSPGMIGVFTGWQIVKKWMEKNDKKTLQQLMQTPPKQIFEESKYKPK